MLLVIAAALIAQDPEGFVELAEDRPQLQSRASWPNRIDARRRRYPFVPHVLSIDWQIQGVTAQLISLSADTSATQGGGHSTDDYDALLWDQLRNRPIAVGQILDIPAFAPRFCAAHAAADRPSEESCPTLDSAPIAPADTNGNGRFDTLRILIAPVSYFEAHGYSIDLPLEPSDIAQLPDFHRPAFEAPGERRAPIAED